MQQSIRDVFETFASEQSGFAVATVITVVCTVGLVVPETISGIAVATVVTVTGTVKFDVVCDRGDYCMFS